MCKEQPYLKIKTENYKLKIYAHSDPMNPREYDNLGTMVCFHPRYSLGDNEKYTHPAVLLNYLQKEGCLYLPLYLLDHSGLVMSTTDFNDRWDSGQVGYIYIAKEKIREEYGVKRISKKFTQRIYGYLQSEVEIYNLYLQGRVYGFVCKNKQTGEEDSCWGFFGENWQENGLAEYLPEEVQIALKGKK